MLGDVWAWAFLVGDCGRLGAGQCWAFLGERASGRFLGVLGAGVRAKFLGEFGRVAGRWANKVGRFRAINFLGGIHKVAIISAGVVWARPTPALDGEFCRSPSSAHGALGAGFLYSFFLLSALDENTKSTRSATE
jgi:hypothetical protein